MIIRYLNSYAQVVVMSKDKVLVIGANGLLGGRILEVGKGDFEFYGTYLREPIKGTPGYELDVLNRKDVFKVIETVKPNCVIHTAALHNVDYCETHPEESWAVNVDGTKNVAEACKQMGAKMVFISTDYVFDGRKLRYTEKDKPNPLSYYAKCKLIAEKVIQALGVNHIIVRASVLYGKGGVDKKNFVEWAVEKLKKGEEIKIVTDQHNNPTFADSLAEIILTLYKKGASGLFHATGPDCMSRFEFARRVAKEFGLKASLIKPTTTPELNQIARRPERVNMIVDKVIRVSGMSPMSVEVGLKELKGQIQ
jgi:dTDP-4-dehydrorhamnose reductase